MRDSQKDLMRFDRPAMEDVLRQAGSVVASGAKQIRCPFHDDLNPSATIREDATGVVKFHCFTCGIDLDYWDILSRVTGTTVEDLLRDLAHSNGQNRAGKPLSSPATASGTPNASIGTSKPATGKERAFPDIKSVVAFFGKSYVAHYAYTDPVSQRVDLLVIRWLTDGVKCFAQYHQAAVGGPIVAGGVAVNPLYNRTRLVKAEVVVVVEGEKDVHTLTPLLPPGWVATTWPGGAAATGKVNWSPLAGKQKVILWPDNDVPGMKAMAEAAAAIQALPAAPAQLMRLVPEWLGLGPVSEKHGLDVTDWINRDMVGGDSAVRSDFLQQALETQVEEISATQDLLERFNEIKSGKRKPIRLVHGALGKVTQALMVGTLTVFGGPAGASKTYFVNQITTDLYRKGVPIAVFHLEEDLTYHMTRTLAQVSGNSHLVDEDWVNAHKDEADAVAKEFREFMNGYSKTITDMPMVKIEYKDILAWCEKKIHAGARVLIVDPITMADPPPNEKPFEADRRLVSSLKNMAVINSISIILVTHPRGGSEKLPFLDRMAGGQAFTRFSQTVLYLEHHEPLEDVKIITDDQVYKHEGEPVNRTIQIAKARNGRGTGLAVGFHFSPKTLCFTEIGVMQPKKKGRR